MATVLVPLADGLEEVEAITIIDLLRRAGVDVTTAALKGVIAEGAHGITIGADKSLDDALNGEYDMVVLPGGGVGAQNLEADPRIGPLMKKQIAAGKFACAICAAPVVLEHAGILEGKKATCYPGFELSSATNTGAPVEVDGKVVTGRGPGTAMDFALALIEQLEGEDKRNEIEAQLVRP